MNKILLNEKNFHFSEADLPCLIHYSEGTGGSHFSVTMIADMFSNGSKILFLTAYPMAKDNFLQQISGNENKVLIATQKYKLTTDKQAILIESGNQNLFLEALNHLDDINERIIFIKNFETFNDKVILAVINRQRLVMSGNLDASKDKNTISEKHFQTIIQFSKSEIKLTKNYPGLEKYSGYFWQNDRDGLIKINTNQL